MKRFPYPKNRRKRGEGHTQAERDALWLKRHPTQHTASMRKWRKKNPGKTYLVTKTYRKKNPLAFRETRIKKVYGINNHIYDEMLKVHNNCCWICKKLSLKRRLSIDHDHKTKQVRGLLCYMCNRYMIGRRRREHAYLFDAASAYLKNETDWRKAT